MEKNNHHHHHCSHKLSRLFSSSCRFNAISDVVIENSIINKNIHPIEFDSKYKEPTKIETKPISRIRGYGTRRPPPPFTPISPLNPKQSSSSNSGLFSTEEEEEDDYGNYDEGGEEESENDEYLSLSSYSSLSPSPKIGTSCKNRSEFMFPELGFCSSSESSTSSINEMKITKCFSKQPLGSETWGENKVRVTLADRLLEESARFNQKTGINLRKTGKSYPKTRGIGSKSMSFCREKKDISFESMLLHRKNRAISLESASSTETECSVYPSSLNKTRDIVLEPSSSSSETESSVSPIPRESSEMRQCPIFMGGKIEESYAVEKDSRDPYGDFKASMVEMIVEKKVKGAQDLEKLLLCFLSLNSSVYHRLILDAFSEICEALTVG